MSDENNNEIERLELALRMQKRMTQEERQKALQAHEDLERKEIEVQKAFELVTEKDKEIEFLRTDAMDKTQLALAEAHRQLNAKDQMIETLKQRFANLNQEFNRSFGRYVGRPPEPDLELHNTPKSYTTLEDVYKMTGEGNVRQRDQGRDQ